MNYRNLKSQDDAIYANALVIDGNPSMRSILTAQLREFGVKKVSQCSRIVDARRLLENYVYGFVLCDLNFPNEATTGQALLNDLRSNNLLPFSTVFIMITGESSYINVAEAAESALDSYLLKPHKPAHLMERLQAARLRKLCLSDIFHAIEEQNFELGANLCVERFNAKGQFWLYAARIGAELLLRVDRPLEAKKLYEAVIQAKTLPWAKLGVARSMLAQGENAAALTVLEKLVNDDPNYADGYDLIGRAQFNLGRYDEALATYKIASTLTPASISRLQSTGMMLFYDGKYEESEFNLNRAALLGRNSIMFDCQSLVLLAFINFDNCSSKGILRCLYDFEHILNRKVSNDREQRLVRFVQMIYTLHQRQIAPVVELVSEMIKEIMLPEFDFEAAADLIGLLSRLATRGIKIEGDSVTVDYLGARFCSSKAMGELLANAALAHPQYQAQIHAGSFRVQQYLDSAISQSLEGRHLVAVQELIFHAEETLNNKFLESASGVLNRYGAIMGDITVWHEKLAALRNRCGKSINSAALGERHRESGALKLRLGSRSSKKLQLLPSASEEFQTQ